MAMQLSGQAGTPGGELKVFLDLPPGSPCEPLPDLVHLSFVLSPMR